MKRSCCVYNIVPLARWTWRAEDKCEHLQVCCIYISGYCICMKQQFQAGYQLSFTLIVPDPSQLITSWNIEQATKGTDIVLQGIVHV